VGKLWQINLSQGSENVLDLERNPECSSSCTVPNPNSSRSLVPGEIDFDEFLKDFKSNASLWRIVDIRSEGFHSTEFLGIEKMDVVDLLAAAPDYLNNSKILIVCEKGRSSQIVQEKLQKLNPHLEVYSLKGGFYSGFHAAAYLESL
jgi:rhodanese-related sulfurtransferase